MTDKERIAELEKERQELLESVEGATMMYKDLQESRKQIERLKNCANCRNVFVKNRLVANVYKCSLTECNIIPFNKCDEWKSEWEVE